MNKKYESMSMVEVAIELQTGAKELTFQELYQKVCEALGYSEEEARAHIAQFYTDVTASGDFIYCGGDKWDLKKNQKLSALDSEFYQEHLADELEGEEEEEEEKPKARRKKKAKVLAQDDEGNIQEVDNSDDEESEDESYENMGDEYESDDSEDYDAYEKDFDSSLDEDDDYEDDEDDEDEDKYNEIMDNFEDLYDN